MFRLYVFPTEASRPSFALLQSIATTRMNELLRDRGVRLATSLSVQTNTPGTRHWGLADLESALPNSLDARNQVTKVLTSNGAAEVRVRVTWVKRDIFGPRGRAAQFDELAGRALGVGHAWVVEFDESTPEESTMFLAGAVACAIAESTRGFIMSWAGGGPSMITPSESHDFRRHWLDSRFGDPERDGWDCLIEEARERYGALDLGVIEPTREYGRADLAGAIIRQFAQRGSQPETLHCEVRQMLGAIDQLEFPIDEPHPSVEQLAAALIRALGAEPKVADHELLRHCAAVNSAVDELVHRLCA